MMSLFGKVKDELQEKIFNKRYKHNWWTKTVWMKLNNNDDSLIYEAIELVRNNVSKYVYSKETNSYESWKIRKVTEISKERNIAINKGQYLEEALERIFVASIDDLYNQFNLLSGVLEQPQTRKSIDIVAVENNSIKEMIELKEWENKNDSPILSALELLLVYFVYNKLIIDKVRSKNRTPPDVCKNLKLSVLAPIDYYEYYGNFEAITLITNAANRYLSEHQSGNFEFSFDQLSGKFGKRKIIQSIPEGDLKALPKDIKSEIKRWFYERKKL